MDAPAAKPGARSTAGCPTGPSSRPTCSRRCAAGSTASGCWCRSLAAVGYLLYRFGVYHEAGIVQPAVAARQRPAALDRAGQRHAHRRPDRRQHLVGARHAWPTRSSAAASAAISISSASGTPAWSTVLGTFLRHGRAWPLVGSFFLLHEDLSLTGSLVALVTVAALLAAVITCGVTVSAMSQQHGAGHRGAVGGALRRRLRPVAAAGGLPVAGPGTRTTCRTSCAASIAFRRSDACSAGRRWPRAWQRQWASFASLDGTCNIQAARRWGWAQKPSQTLPPLTYKRAQARPPWPRRPRPSACPIPSSVRR